MSVNRKWNAGWQFSRQPLGTGLAEAEAEPEWMPVSLPHDWLIYNTQNLYEDGEGWYRKNLTFAEVPEDRCISLRFEGVYMNSSLYVNGQLAGEWKYGYSTFEFEITPFLTAGDNEIVMRVIHESPNSRWYSGAGIYRSVWLKTYPKSHIVPDGIYIAARPADGDWWNVDVDCELELEEGLAMEGVKLRHTILDAAGFAVEAGENTVSVNSASGTVYEHIRLKVKHPLLWDIHHPSLYTLRTELLVQNEVTEEQEQTFGFRTVELDPQRGFFLNGRRLKLNGVCQHHDLGCLGAAVNKAALRRQIVLLQEMGVNAIRTAHNMPAVEFMELADEMGVLVVSEAFDMWERSKTPYDYARFFPAWWKRDVASWVRRDRNCPSLIMWSIGNEIYDTHADSRGQEVTAMLQEEVLAHDPLGNGFVTIGSNYMPWENARKCAELVKAAGYNYGEKYYDRHHQEHPDWIIYGSETCSTVQSRGVYHFPLAQPVLADDDQQCSSLGNSSTSWGSRSTEACIIADRDAAYSLGQFIWTGFDYIGEPTPYFTKNAYFGQLDTAGFPKDSYYIYQAEWTDYRITPMVHIFPYWDFSEGQLIDVRVTSNAPRIELFFNDVSQGTYEIDHAHGHKLLGEWQLPYATGELRAVAYDDQGEVIAEDRQCSFSDAAALLLTPDKQELTADGEDLIFVTVTAADSKGRPVNNANNRVRLSIEGPGRLVGLDNGDSTDYDPYKGVSRRMFSGRLLAVIAATREAGTLKVQATSPGMAAAVLILSSAAPAAGKEPEEEHCLYADCPLEARQEPEEILSVRDTEIPVRKLEIITPEGSVLSPERPVLPVRVRLHPENATFREAEWRITNAAGVDANIAVIQGNGHEAVISALGDGEVYIRCGTANGADGIRLYSQMQLKLTGFGQANLDPYGFISAAYHSSASINLTNGNERGAATAREGESLIVFERVDFGSYGSDEIILPVFSLDSEAFPVEIWEGIPGNPDAQLLAAVTYRKETQWNVYQEEKYKLPKRLTGITSLSFVLRRKIHLKGFRFVKLHKAYGRLHALESSRIYGDTFIRTETAVEGIGNNVSLVFDEMDFGEQGSSRIVICGRSPLANSTLHLLFSGPDGESRQLIEFAGAEDYVERAFSLEPAGGSCTVTFLFLPGTRFDFRWFRFEP
ncbi:glycoside hydrolase family 2 [Paenibacillus sp. PK3_47]|uniref:glycoside hydrolase family 2 TIM barrel-domain containing protein n=1 Tax=Paenibacillus sp. PK3_47 TaxID=2072642 RepID=UPI00201D5EB3|nr:glycoside hydrolase family 2 TIM barrel-domain containing protein [Paenibacillus sp. PK3_47]UQZ32678.1 glycoside hydrolase family 2 [Paenibacillus sp. PK3_47]